jgi:hypothetical protein
VCSSKILIASFKDRSCDWKKLMQYTIIVREIRKNHTLHKQNSSYYLIKGKKKKRKKRPTRKHEQREKNIPAKKEREK